MSSALSREDRTKKNGDVARQKARRKSVGDITVGTRGKGAGDKARRMEKGVGTQHEKRRRESEIET